MELLECYQQNKIEAGCDEAGRGCLAGPVYAAAVILPKNFYCKELNDSKKLTDKQRQTIRVIIEENAISWAVASVSSNMIDKINILRASIMAMHKALENLSITPQHIIVDGNKFVPYRNIPHQTIVKGDSKYASIAAASILAKTHRDEFMNKMHKKYPNYNWDINKGYPTKKHFQSIAEFGITPIHRKSFRLYNGQITIEF